MFVKLDKDSWLNLTQAKSVWLEADRFDGALKLCVVWLGDDPSGEFYQTPRYYVDKTCIATLRAKLGA